jgi:mitogen-activated protein kinase 1/3
MDNNTIFHNKYQFKERIGEGAFGTVVKVYNLGTKEFLALKLILVPKESDHLRRILREILLLKHLKHEHLILLKDVFMMYQNDQIYIGFVTDLMKMNMRAMMKTYWESMSNMHIRFFMYQLFLGLDYLHFNDILHRDLKPDNILVNNLNHLQIADFGWARVIPTNQNKFTKTFANIHYRAPEICVESNEIGPPVDIWAVGCIFFEILEKKNLFRSTFNAELIQEIVQTFGLPPDSELNFITDVNKFQWIKQLGNYPKQRPSKYLKLELDEHGKDLLDQCLHFDPRKRITTTQALRHPYFEELYESNEVNLGLTNDSSKIDFSFEKSEFSNDKMYLLKQIMHEINIFKPQ